MNAYELADKLDKSKAWLDSLNTQYKNGFGKYCLLPNEVALMLRQQADRIAELEKAFISQRVEAYAKSLTDRTKASAIAKVLNAEPKDIWTVCLDCGKRVTGDSIHTCSPQIKELSDEEIWELAHPHGDLAWQDCTLEFARAILKKASE